MELGRLRKKVRQQKDTLESKELLVQTQLTDLKQKDEELKDKKVLMNTLTHQNSKLAKAYDFLQSEVVELKKIKNLSKPQGNQMKSYPNFTEKALKVMSLKPEKKDYASIQDVKESFHSFDLTLDRRMD